MDPATNAGLMYYNARYYGATIGRFIQPDTVIPDLYDPQSLNRYTYVRNNPVRNTDPTGHGVDLGDPYYNAEMRSKRASETVDWDALPSGDDGGNEGGGSIVDHVHVSDLKGLARKLVGENTSAGTGALAVPEDVGLSVREYAVIVHHTFSFMESDVLFENGAGAGYSGVPFTREWNAWIKVLDAGDSHRGFTSIEIQEIWPGGGNVKNLMTEARVMVNTGLGGRMTTKYSYAESAAVEIFGSARITVNKSYADSIAPSISDGGSTNLCCGMPIGVWIKASPMQINGTYLVKATDDYYISLNNIMK